MPEKTCLAPALPAGLGVDPDVPITSPTYTLLNCYEGRLPLYHFDLYRLGGDDELEELGFDEFFMVTALLWSNGLSVVRTWSRRVAG